MKHRRRRRSLASRMPHRTMVMRKTLHLSHCLVSFPAPSAFIGSFVFLRCSSARTVVDALRFSSCAAGCYPLRRHGGFGEVGTQSPLPELKKRTFNRVSAASWLPGFGTKKEKAPLPEIVKAGDPVLHEPAGEVSVQEIGSEKIQKIIDDMIACMRKVPGVGLAAPQIGVPLKIIVLEDTKEYISYAPKNEIKAQDRRPFDLLVIINPKLKNKSDKTALFFEGCLSIDGFRALVERYLEVEVTGLDRQGQPIKIDARGWQARILQHECNHLDGTLYVDKMVPRTFRTVENLALPLAAGCPPLGDRLKD
ncbi:peptide deformylase 1A, chloroplastic/mitochondrial-like [Zingiber officinale]|uniref:peptide deformylase 1A, chloroplastic/mitochondrial-like n=1 Tax=Zingiber officinale TaxID=94328 RepID=UPI001C4B613D|nr:peptide deformylase 1A, chloroplastic/mitochondrial-like [Zingiber officinale]